MQNSDFSETVGKLRQEVVRIENQAHVLSAQFQTLCTKTEVLKIDTLERRLANRTKSVARQAGFKSMARDGKNLGVGLVAAGFGIIFGAALMGDGLSVLTSGMSGFDGTLQELGKPRWAVSLDGDMLVVPKDQIAPGRSWVTMESLVVALEELREKACNGDQCGNLGSVIERLKRGHSKLNYLLPVCQWVAIPQNGGTDG